MNKSHLSSPAQDTPRQQSAASHTVSATHAKALRDHFVQITGIPHRSMHEDNLREHIRRQAEGLGLAWKIDATGNLLVEKPATKGFEDRPPVALQAHMDMVCVADDAHFDFDTMSITTVIEDGWLRADGTSLGADDGIGLALMLVLMQQQDIRHGKLELLFTVDEERLMTGAANLAADALTARTLINLDSEEFDRVTIGSAGGVNNEGFLPFATVPAPADYAFYQVTLDGGLGGHSGDMIHKGRANMIKLLAQFLGQIQHSHGLVVVDMQGGQVRNSIPRSAMARVGVPSSAAQAFAEAFAAFAATARTTYASVDPDLTFDLTPVAAPSHVVEQTAAQALLDFVNAAPNGVIQMSHKLPGLVESSSNLGILRTHDAGFAVEFVIRSSVDAELDTMCANLDKVYAAHAANATAACTGRYPGWDADPASPLLKAVTAAFQEVCGISVQTVALHVGLECGYFARTWPGMDMVSIGPLMRDVHSTKERVKLSTLDDLWRVLLRTLETV